MRRSPPPGKIRPKISSMPRQKSEDTACLDVYKLVVERKRLKLELEKLEQRRQIICDRIQQLDGQISHLENEIQVMREVEGGTPSPEGTGSGNTGSGNTVKAAPRSKSVVRETVSGDLEEFDTLTLDY